MASSGIKGVILDSIFSPGSVAIAGFGEGDMGQVFLDILPNAGFKGKVYLLDPKGGEISGLEAYTDIRDVLESVDYVISCMAPPLVPQLIKDCAAKGVKVISILGAGFSERGSTQCQLLEEEVQRLADASGLRIFGPGGLGVYCPAAGLSFAFDLPKESGWTASSVRTLAEMPSI